MEQIKKELFILCDQQEELTNEQIMAIFFQIGLLGDILLLKNDGIRIENMFSIVIIGGKGVFENIRVDGSNLSQIVKTAISKYIKH